MPGDTFCGRLWVWRNINNHTMNELQLHAEIQIHAIQPNQRLTSNNRDRST